jgi:hypothetical protein
VAGSVFGEGDEDFGQCYVRVFATPSQRDVF